MNEKIIITDKEWQEIFEKIWENCRNICSSYNDSEPNSMGNCGLVEFKGHKYYHPESFSDSIEDDIKE